MPRTKYGHDISCPYDPPPIDQDDGVPGEYTDDWD